MRYDKLAFVHMMRSGGTYLMTQFSQAGYEPCCAWLEGLKRDWNRAELFIHLAQRTPPSVIHAHSIAWDEETVTFARRTGWRVVAIVRDPVEQLASLCHYWNEERTFVPFEIDAFVARELDVENPDSQFRNWQVPPWWRLIDEIIPYCKSLPAVVRRRFEIEADENVYNSRGCYPLPSSESVEAIRRSVFYARYLEASCVTITHRLSNTFGMRNANKAERNAACRSEQQL